MAVLVCDASEGVTAEDLRIGELAMKTGCATLVALNKWDLSGRTGPGREAEEADRFDLEDAKARLAKRIRQRPPVIATSATGAAGSRSCSSARSTLADRRAERIPTPELNRFVNEVVASRPPPQKRGKRLRALLHRPDRHAGRRGSRSRSTTAG